ncbi:hypothetical protein [Chamaesiphon sp. VAR_48_metabat_403]|uniref:hypothetical protein n=1 Tax=Chamaesiphon sp. VAR_48_metabat_403 TaxID=2964700 RepID=UPI00286EA7E9|nr:hypothetical protein [Chamaesiphon sp. VAR_48_metabat_403]
MFIINSILSHCSNLIRPFTSSTLGLNLVSPSQETFTVFGDFCLVIDLKFTSSRVDRLHYTISYVLKQKITLRHW